MTTGQSKKIKIGVSSCLLGELTRYDGSHKKSDFILNELHQKFELISICPEVLMGLGVPRPPIHRRLVNGIHELVDRDNSKINYTQKMNEEFEKLRPLLDTLSAFILKSKSPSCGTQNVDLFNASGALMDSNKTQGLFAELLEKNYPKMKLFDEHNLSLDQFLKITAP